MEGTLLSRVAQAIAIGSVARRELENAIFGRVTAVFEHSLYLEINGSWICLADANLGFGPLNVSVKRNYERKWFNSFTVGRLVKLSPLTITQLSLLEEFSLGTLRRDLHGQKTR